MVTSSLAAGGAERVLSDMANYWCARGWQVTLATWSGPDTEDFYALDSGVVREWLDVHSPNDSSVAKMRSNAARVRRLRGLIRRRCPDAVLSFIDWSNVLTIVASRGTGVRTVVSERIHPAHYRGLARPWRMLRMLTYRYADVVVGQTAEVTDWLRARCSAPATTIPNPLRELPRIDAEREKTVLGVGRLVRQKGFDVLIDAFARVHPEHPDWRLQILGTGPEREALLAMAREIGVAESFDLGEPVRNIEDWMARAGILVQPSRYEGFPNVLLEGMGMGVPVISADCPSGPSEIIDDGVNGLLVPVEDAGALADALMKLMAGPELRHRLGSEAVLTRERFGQQRIMAAWERQLFPDWTLGNGADGERMEREIGN
jgi:glycosyltransferase involved in cell wall biosynthesis